MEKEEQERIYPWGDHRRFNSYSGYFRRTFGFRVQKVTVDAGFTCPNRDGSLSVGGCTFCNNSAFTPAYNHAGGSVAEQIEQGIAFHARRYRKAQKFLAYFQSYSNTYKPLGELKAIYGQAFSHPDVIGLVIGTRPDCVDEAKLDYFASLAQKYYVIIEYGVESVYDRTLLNVNRGHDFETARRAIEMTAERGLRSGAHFILGLPGETEQMLVAQAGAINSLPLDTVKFHQLQIFRDTAMAADYAAHPEHYRFWSVEEYIDLFIDLLERLRPSLVIERFAGEAAPDYRIETLSWKGLRNEQLMQLFERRLAERHTWQGRLYRKTGSRPE